MRSDPVVDSILGYVQVSTYFRNSDKRVLSSHFLSTNRRWKAEPFRTKTYDTCLIRSNPNPGGKGSETRKCNPAASALAIL